MFKLESPVVLLIDDAVDVHKLFELMLKPIGLRMEHAYSGREGLAMAMRVSPDLILLDYQMPEVDGLAVLKFLKREPLLKEKPVILITASDDHQLISDAFAAGAADYVRKPVLVTELRARVSSVIKTRRLIHELSHVARTDELTQLFNRDAFNKCLAETLSQSPQPSISILFIDLDRFSVINDSQGHGCGDLILKEVALRLQTELSTNSSILRRSFSSVVSRFGGDSFIVMIEGPQHESDARLIADQLLNALSVRYNVGHHELYLSASIAIAVTDKLVVTAEEMIRNAEIALYEAKATGGSTCSMFDKFMSERFHHRASIERELRSAILNNEFILDYQPIIDLQTGHVDSIEALIRWNHPTRGLISPLDFIPIAEETGFIGEIGEWVLHTAISQFAMWQRNPDLVHGMPNSVSINLARQQLIRPRFAASVVEIARTHGVAPKHVHLEITESEMMTKVDLSIEVMRELRAEGFKIDVDDFGTGYSSLACLNQFPVDVLKIDRSLISKIAREGYSSKLVEFVLQLANETAVSVVAEGIETQSQANQLAEWGCHLGQGYYFSRPLKAELVPSFIRQWNDSKPPMRVKPRRAPSLPLEGSSPTYEANILQ